MMIVYSQRRCKRFHLKNLQKQQKKQKKIFVCKRRQRMRLTSLQLQPPLAAAARSFSGVSRQWIQ